MKLIFIIKLFFLHIQKVKTKTEISWEREELLRWNKSIFHHFSKAFIEANKKKFGRWESDFKFDWLIIFFSRIHQERWKLSAFFSLISLVRFLKSHDYACSVLKVFCPRRNFTWMENDLYVNFELVNVEW